MIFDPRHTLAKVPEGAKAGDKLNVALYDGLKTAYVLPPGFKPGDEINLRHSKEHEEVVVNLKKTEETSSLGLAIKSQKTRPYPFVIDVDPVGPSPPGPLYEHPPQALRLSTSVLGAEMRQKFRARCCLWAVARVGAACRVARIVCVIRSTLPADLGVACRVAFVICVRRSTLPADCSSGWGS